MVLKEAEVLDHDPLPLAALLAQVLLDLGHVVPVVDLPLLVTAEVGRVHRVDVSGRRADDQYGTGELPDQAPRLLDAGIAVAQPEVVVEFGCVLDGIRIRQGQPSRRRTRERSMDRRHAHSMASSEWTRPGSRIGLSARVERHDG
jgi:hypothetical protein